MDKSTKRIKWIDGLKAIACIGVFFHHFVGSFYPAYNTGNPADSRIYGLDSLVCNTPLGIVINGNFWVCIFLAVSAYVLSIQVMSCEPKDLRKKAGSILIKRYVRLAIPMLVIGIVDYITLTNALKTDSIYALARGDMSFVDAIYRYLTAIWIYPDANVFAQLWTMHYLFRTAIVVVVLTVFDRKESWYAPIIYLIAIYPLLIVNECYIAIVSGIIIADLTYFERGKQLFSKNKVLNSIWENNIFQRALALMLMVLAVYLGGYPSNTSPVGVYGFLLGLDNRFPFFSGYLHGIAAFLLMASLFLFRKNNSKKDILASTPLQVINKYSLAIYMIHGFFIIYFCPYIYVLLKSYFSSYNLLVAVILVITIILVGITSVIFNKTVERFVSYICSKI